MNVARDTGLLFRRSTLQLLRNPVWVFVGFAVLVPLCAVVLAWATSVFRRAVA